MSPQEVERITLLVVQKINETIDEAGDQELTQWLAASPDNRALFNRLTNPLDIEDKLKEFNDVDVLKSWQRARRAIRGDVRQMRGAHSWYKQKWFIATVLILVATGSIFIFKNTTRQTPLQGEQAKQTSPKEDVLPGGDKAVLVMADGQTITLDNTAAENLGRQGDMEIINRNGQLSYEKTKSSDGDITHHGPTSYNTLSTPRGGQYQLRLPDGSRVWLNAQSSIRYPTSFMGEKRSVEITGEVYFEVVTATASLSKREGQGARVPFSVKVNGMEVNVLGTSFNINAYNNEPGIKTTLISGSIKVSAGNNSKLLKPNQQSAVNLNSGENTIVVSDTDPESSVAWISGNFNFNRDDIETVMRQLERWYDVEVVYASKKPVLHFSGDISRNTGLSNVLKMLEFSGVKFTLQGKKITVL